MSTEPVASTVVGPEGGFGIDVDRAGSARPVLAGLRRRWDGRYPIDVFGADPQLMDAVAPLLALGVRVRVEGGEHLPTEGGALIVSNRVIGLAEPFVLAAAVRRATGRRLRPVGAPGVPGVGPLLRKLGALPNQPADVAAALRAGALVAAPMRQSWPGTTARVPPWELLAAVLGFPVVPVAIRAGGPLGAPLGPWRVRVGEIVETHTDAVPGDALAGAELGERTAAAVAALLHETPDHVKPEHPTRETREPEAPTRR